jgi:hypothetical protein
LRRGAPAANHASHAVAAQRGKDPVQKLVNLLIDDESSIGTV